MTKRKIDDNLYYEIISESLYYTASCDVNGYIACDALILYNLLNESNNLNLFINKINLENAEMILLALDETLINYKDNHDKNDEINKTKEYICLTFSLSFH